MTERARTTRFEPRINLRRARTRRGWSESDVAKKLSQLGIEHEVEEELGVDARTVSRWELGKARPNQTYTALLSLLYELPPEQLDLPRLVLPVAQPKVAQPSDAATTIQTYDPAEMKRRQFMEHGLAILGAATATELHRDLPFRLLHALNRPAAIDRTVIDYLHGRATEQWRTWNAHTLRSDVLMMFTHDELHRLTRLLEGSLAPSVRDELIAVAGNLSLLCGVLHWDTRSYSQARSYMRNAVTAAHEGKDNTLGAAAYGWLSFAWTYSGDARWAVAEALQSVQSGRSLSQVRPHVQRWLAAVEAEVHATMRNTGACTAALRDAEEMPSDNPSTGDDNEWTQYDSILFAGYKGACHLLLHEPRHAAAELLAALQMSRSRRTRQARVESNLLADLARAYSLDGRVGEACEVAGQALQLNESIQSAAQFQRLDVVITDLGAKTDAREVRLLAEQSAAVKQEPH